MPRLNEVTRLKRNVALVGEAAQDSCGKAVIFNWPSLVASCGLEVAKINCYFGCQEQVACGNSNHMTLSTKMDHKALRMNYSVG